MASGADRRIVVGTTVGVTADLFLRGQLHWLVEQGYEVHLVSTPDDAAQRAAAREGVTLVPVPMAREVSPRADASALLAWVRILGRLRPSTVNVSTPKAGLLGLLAALAVRVPRRVYLVRGVRYEGASGRSRALLKAMERVSLMAATDVVAVSNSVKDVLVGDGLVAASKVRVIGAGSSNGVDTVRIREAAGSTRRVATGRLVVGVVGRMVPDKGLDEIGRAMSDPRCSRMDLVTVGDDGEDMTPEYDLLAQQGRWRKVPWTDNVAREVAGFDVLLHASHREGFPNVVLEAAALGVPAVASAVTGNVDAVVDGVTGLLFPRGDSDALVECLLAMTDPEARSRMGEAAQRRVEEEFTPLRVWEGMEAVYRGEA